MHRGHVQRIVAAADAQEAGRLLEGLRARSPARRVNCARERKRPCSLRYSTIFCAVRSLIPAT